MRVIAITNQKGGSCKTTTAVCLAGALAERERCVLVVDLDSQGNATDWLGIELDGDGLLEVLGGGAALSDLIQPTAFDRLDAVAGGVSLALAERRLAGARNQSVLRDAVRELPRGRWDYVLLDCPPALDVRSVAALAASREVLVPIEAAAMPLQGLVGLTRTVAAVKRELNDRLRIAGILACRVDRRTNLSQDVVGELRERFPELVFGVEVRENVRVKEAPSFRAPITAYAATSAGAEDYRAAAAELEARAA